MSTATAVHAPRSYRAPAPPDGRVAALARRAAAGDRDVLDELVSEFEGLLWAIARGHRLSDADAGDVAQTAWLQLLQNLHRLEDPTRMGAWLATTARRECLRKLRASAREIPNDEPPEPAAESPAIDGPLLEAERDATLWSAFGRLPSRDQALLRMLVVDPQPSYEEIGAALDMPVGSIGPTRGRALERLRRELEGSEPVLQLVA
jgi:RNA polymerase sigma factor (sigma-70 family)